MFWWYRLGNSSLGDKDTVRCKQRRAVLIKFLSIEHNPRAGLDGIGYVHNDAIELFFAVLQVCISISDDQFQARIICNLVATPFGKVLFAYFDDFAIKIDHDDSFHRPMTEHLPCSCQLPSTANEN